MVFVSIICSYVQGEVMEGLVKFEAGPIMKENYIRLNAFQVQLS